MAEYKTTWFFEGLQQNPGTTANSVVTWTETWYQTATNLDEAIFLAANGNDNNGWVGRRRQFLHALYSIKWVRVSNDANPRETKLSHVMGLQFGEMNYTPNSTGGQAAANTGAQVQCCVLVDVMKLPQGDGDKAHHRRLQLRGLPRSIMDGNVLSENSQAFNKMLGFLNYVARVRTPEPRLGLPVPVWKIRYQNPTAVFVPITALAQTAGNDRSITISAGLPGANHGRRLEIRRVASVAGVNRIWTVRAAAAVPAGGPYVLVRSKTPIVGTWVPNDGVAALITPLYGPADQYTIIGLRDRQTGANPFGRTRGRRRAR